MSRTESDIINAPVDFDSLDLQVLPDQGDIRPVKVGATGQVIKIKKGTPARTVKMIIEGHVRAVRRSKQANPDAAIGKVAGTSAQRPVYAGEGPAARFSDAAAQSIGLDDPLGNAVNFGKTVLNDPVGAIKSLASPQNQPPVNEETRIPTAGGPPLRPAEASPAIESIPIVGSIFQNMRVRAGKGDIAGMAGSALPFAPALAKGVRGAVGAARGLMSGGGAAESGAGAVESAVAGAETGAGGAPPIQSQPLQQPISIHPQMDKDIAQYGMPYSAHKSNLPNDAARNTVWMAYGDGYQSGYDFTNEGAANHALAHMQDKIKNSLPKGVTFIGEQETANGSVMPLYNLDLGDGKGVATFPLKKGQSMADKVAEVKKRFGVEGTVEPITTGFSRPAGNLRPDEQTVHQQGMTAGALDHQSGQQSPPYTGEHPELYQQGYDAGKARQQQIIDGMQAPPPAATPPPPPMGVSPMGGPPAGAPPPPPAAGAGGPQPPSGMQAVLDRLRQAGSSASDSMNQPGPLSPRPPRDLPVGGAQVPMTLGEQTGGVMTQKMEELAGGSNPVLSFNRDREQLLQNAIKSEASKMYTNREGLDVSNLNMMDGTTINLTTLTLPKLAEQGPLAITQLKHTLTPESYSQLLHGFFGQIIEDSMKPGSVTSVAGQGVTSAQPTFDAAKLMQQLDAIPKDKLAMILDGTSARSAVTNMRDLAGVLDKLQKDGTLLPKLEQFEIAGSRRFGPAYLRISDLTGLLGINWIIGQAVTHPQLMIGMKNFLKAGVKTSAEAAAAEGVINNALKQNYGKEKPGQDIRRPFDQSAETGAVGGDVVDAISGDPQMMQALLDKADRVINPVNVNDPSHPVNTGGQEFGDMMLASTGGVPFRPGSLGEVYSKVRKAADVMQKSRYTTGEQMLEKAMSLVDEGELDKAGVLDWLREKASRGGQALGSEFRQLVRNLEMRAKDANPAEFERMASTSQKAVAARTARSTAPTSSAPIDASQSINEAAGIKPTDYQGSTPFDQSMTPTIKNRPAWAQDSGGRTYYLANKDAEFIRMKGEWKKKLGDAKREIDYGAVNKSAAQLKVANENFVRTWSKFQRWEQEFFEKNYKGLNIDVPGGRSTDPVALRQTQDERDMLNRIRKGRQ